MLAEISQQVTQPASTHVCVVGKRTGIVLVEIDPRTEEEKRQRYHAVYAVPKISVEICPVSPDSLVLRNPSLPPPAHAHDEGGSPSLPSTFGAAKSCAQP